MSFIEIRVEDYIDSAQEADRPIDEAGVKLLRQFCRYLDEQTDVFTVKDLTPAHAHEFLRTLKGAQRQQGHDQLQGFFLHLEQGGFLPGGGNLLAAGQPAAGRRSALTPGQFDEDDEDDDTGKRRGRRGFDG